MFKVVLIKGDGIGPEIAYAVVEILELIHELSLRKIKWMNIEKLQLFNSEIGYSNAQGEKKKLR